MFQQLLDWALLVAFGYAAHAALILLLISIVDSIPSKWRDALRAASRIAALVVAGAGLLLLGTFVLNQWHAVLTGSPYELWSFVRRAFGPYVWVAWVALLATTIGPQLLWLPSVRRATLATALVAAFALTGHAFTFFVFRVATATPDRLPTSWDELPTVLF